MKPKRKYRKSGLTDKILLISAYIQAGTAEKGKGPKDKTISQSLCVPRVTIYATLWWMISGGYTV